MRRPDLEHVIRAAGTIANVDDVTVISSQAVLGQFPAAPAELLVSNEADVFPTHHPERSDLIDSTIGEDRPFSSRSDTTLTASMKQPRCCRPGGGTG
ncbi:MAG: hypothetical protein JST11_15095 [Acidobacteria bacterium]|nr:hypothetical protein [Acidobacteriota bacterium]